MVTDLVNELLMNNHWDAGSLRRPVQPSTPEPKLDADAIPFAAACEAAGKVPVTSKSKCDGLLY
jgi:hypothetical protein